MRILTFDIEEWFVYQLYDKGGKGYYLPIINSYLDCLLDLLDTKNMKATFFCLGIIAKEYPDVIRKIAYRKHEIGCHSYQHLPVNRMNNKRFKQDTHQAISLLEDSTGERICGYRAPAFSIADTNYWILDILVEQGIEYDCSSFPSHRSYIQTEPMSKQTPYLIKHNGCYLKEFPIYTKTIGNCHFPFSGGSYFRIMPYQLIKQFTSESSYIMSYFHIRDFDAKQIRVISPSYFISYYGIKKAYRKFEQYLSDFNFISVAKASECIDWGNASTVEIPTNGLRSPNGGYEEDMDNI